MPPDEQARPWLPSATSECPVELDKQRWIESSLRWFTDQFGTTVLSRDIVPPDADFVSERGYSGSRAQVEELLTRLCELMTVDPASISLELSDGDASDPRVLTAIAVREMCHVLIQGRVDRDRPDSERLTDLLSVYFGFGVFSTNAAMRFATQFASQNAARNEGYHRLGHLSSTEWGYALACYSWLRGEKEPGWARYLDPGPRVYLEQGLAYLGRTSADAELPTQRLLDKSVRIGDVTVRVTRGAILGPGHLGLMLPGASQAGRADLKPLLDQRHDLRVAEVRGRAARGRTEERLGRAAADELLGGFGVAAGERGP
jgi:hypothetical protein